VVAGRYGYAEFINGVYEAQSGTIRDGRPVYRLVGGVPGGHGTMSGSSLYLFFNEAAGEWRISPVFEGSNLMAYVRDKALHPADARGVWMVLTSSGEHEDDTGLTVARAPVVDSHDAGPAPAGLVASNSMGPASGAQGGYGAMDEETGSIGGGSFYQGYASDASEDDGAAQAAAMLRARDDGAFTSRVREF
jgi:hypothetical protein